MTPLFSATILTLFPEMFPGPLGHSLAGTALKKGIWALDTVNIRDFATDKHRTVDASPYGGGVGMVLKPDIVHAAIEFALCSSPHRGEAGRGADLGDKTFSASQDCPPPNLPPVGGGTTLIYTSPRGVPFTQTLAESFKNQHLIILCGRFEGVDQRVLDRHKVLEVSLGDFVLSGGEIAALAMLDAIVRLLPGVIGNEEAVTQESFATSENFAGLLEYPHYTRPPLWEGVAVPEVLLSGNHADIQSWRLEQARKITAARRPDLLKKKD
jgi:tRNA (guanine37-N1)-methyltransferase